jgi:hypothetical protein
VSVYFSVKYELTTISPAEKNGLAQISPTKSLLAALREQKQTHCFAGPACLYPADSDLLQKSVGEP